MTLARLQETLIDDPVAREHMCCRVVKATRTCSRERHGPTLVVRPGFPALISTLLAEPCPPPRGLNAVLCGLSAVLCGLSAVLCGLSVVLCGLSVVLCGLSAVLCGLSVVLCRLSVVTEPG